MKSSRIPAWVSPYFLPAVPVREGVAARGSCLFGEGLRTEACSQKLGQPVSVEAQGCPCLCWLASCFQNMWLVPLANSLGVPVALTGPGAQGMALGWGLAGIGTGAALAPSFPTMDHWPRDPSSVPPAALPGAEISGVLQQGTTWPLRNTYRWQGFKREESKKENTELSWNKVIASIPHLLGLLQSPLSGGVGSLPRGPQCCWAASSCRLNKL